MRRITVKKTTKGQKTGVRSSLRRKPEKTYSEASFGSVAQNEESEIAELREQLIETRDFDNVSITKLIAVQQRMKGYIQTCMADREYVKARDAKQFDEDLRTEIQRQAEVLDQHRSHMRAVTTFKRSTAKANADPMLRNFDKETTQKENAMLARHRQTMQEFESIWSGRMAKQYHRPSTHLREMKMRRQEFEKNGNIIEAAALQDEIDIQECAERSSQEHQYWKDYQKSKAGLNEKFKNEEKMFRASREKQRALVQMRSKGMYTGPVEQQPAPRSITMNRPKQYQSIQTMMTQKVKTLPPLCQTKSLNRRANLTIHTATQFEICDADSHVTLYAEEDLMHNSDLPSFNEKPSEEFENDEFISSAEDDGVHKEVASEKESEERTIKTEEEEKDEAVNPFEAMKEQIDDMLGKDKTEEEDVNEGGSQHLDENDFVDEEPEAHSEHASEHCEEEKKEDDKVINPFTAMQEQIDDVLGRDDSDKEEQKTEDPVEERNIDKGNSDKEDDFEKDEDKKIEHPEEESPKEQEENEKDTTNPFTAMQEQIDDVLGNEEQKIEEKTHLDDDDFEKDEDKKSEHHEEESVKEEKKEDETVENTDPGAERNVEDEHEPLDQDDFEKDEDKKSEHPEEESVKEDAPNPFTAIQDQIDDVLGKDDSDKEEQKTEENENEKHLDEETHEANEEDKDNTREQHQEESAEQQEEKKEEETGENPIVAIQDQADNVLDKEEPREDEESPKNVHVTEENNTEDDVEIDDNDFEKDDDTKHPEEESPKEQEEKKEDTINPFTAMQEQIDDVLGKDDSDKEEQKTDLDEDDFEKDEDKKSEHAEEESPKEDAPNPFAAMKEQIDGVLGKSEENTDLDDGFEKEETNNASLDEDDFEKEHETKELEKDPKPDAAKDNATNQENELPKLNPLSVNLVTPVTNDTPTQPLFSMPVLELRED